MSHAQICRIGCLELAHKQTYSNKDAYGECRANENACFRVWQQGSLYKSHAKMCKLSVGSFRKGRPLGVLTNRHIQVDDIRKERYRIMKMYFVSFFFVMVIGKYEFVWIIFVLVLSLSKLE